jgi:oligopeptide transport system substrate-binding protein
VGVRALDEATLAVELERPTGHFLYLLAHNISYPVPRHAVAAHGEAWTEVANLVTNGPFRLEAWSQEGELVLSRNPTYHGRFTGNVERVELVSLPDTSARLGAYETENLDVLSLWNYPEERDRARQRHAGDYVSAPFLAATYVGFDVSRPPFKDPRIRRAFALAVHRERWADEVMGGYFFPATGGFVPPGMAGHSAGIGLPYDPDQGQRLLVEAGYPGGRGFPEVELLTDEGHASASGYLVPQWRENLGVEITCKAMEWTAFVGRLEGGPPGIFLGTWYADYPDPDSFLRVCDAIRWTRCQNETFHGLVDKARHVTDQQERIKMYCQADRILAEEAVLMPFAYLRTHLLVKPWVRQLPTSAIKWWYWQDVIVEPH